MKIGKNQFLFSYGDFQNINFSNKILIDEYVLFLGSDCNVIKVRENNRELVLIGYIASAEYPLMSEEELCRQLLKSLDEGCENAAILTEYWGGRWVIFASINHNLFVWNDACALKQVFFDINNQKGQVYIASQARYIARIKRYEIDNEARIYMEQAKIASKEYALPLDRTLYANVRRLLPNRILINNGASIKPMNFLKNTVAYKGGGVLCEVKKILQNGMMSVISRYNVAVTLTAGWDSRLVFSSCLSKNKKLEIVSFQYLNMDDNNLDITIPSDICRDLGYNHTIVKCRDVSSGFSREYEEHAENAHEYWKQMAQGVKDYNYGDFLWVKGSCNEIVRNAFGNLYNCQINANILCYLFDIPQTSFSLSAVNEWLLDAREFCKRYDFKILDLFYWEQRMGSWLAECLNENDVVGETYSPFNVRAYLMLASVIPFKERIAPKYEFFNKFLLSCGMSSLDLNFRKSNNISTRLKILIKYHMPLIYNFVIRVGMLNDNN